MQRDYRSLAFPLLVLLRLGLVPNASAEEGQLTTEHLRIQWVEGTTPEVIDRAQTDGERYYAAIRELLGHDTQSRITILLRGPARQPDGSYDHPRVDGIARIHLFQYEGIPESYFSALAHEMVHVFRFSRHAEADWFFEEGFAEFIALRLDPSLDGFPWYGFPVDVVAGQWIAQEEDIPLEALRNNHDALNLPCRIQSYALRASFFQYLAEAHAADSVLAMAAEPTPGAPGNYTRFFGSSFPDVATAWREAIGARFRDLENASELGRQYREDSPAQYMPVCREGEDY